MRKLLLLCAVSVLVFSCSNRKKELQVEANKNLNLQMDNQKKIIEKKMFIGGDDATSNNFRATVKKLEAETLELEKRYKVINDSIELLK